MVFSFIYSYTQPSIICLLLENVFGNQWPYFGQFWTGLRNPNKQICYDAGCVSKLKWDSDGSFLSNWPDTSHGLYANMGDDCLRYGDVNINDHGCEERYYYICEFQCPSTTTTTTTTTTTATPQGEIFTAWQKIMINMQRLHAQLSTPVLPICRLMAKCSDSKTYSMRQLGGLRITTWDENTIR